MVAVGKTGEGVEVRPRRALQACAEGSPESPRLNHACSLPPGSSAPSCTPAELRPLNAALLASLLRLLSQLGSVLGVCLVLVCMLQSCSVVLPLPPVSCFRALSSVSLFLDLSMTFNMFYRNTFLPCLLCLLLCVFSSLTSRISQSALRAPYP